MNTRNTNFSNYLAPPSFQAGAVECSANSGIAPRVVDPQVNASLTSTDDLRAELSRARRKLLADVAGDFASSHDRMLRELAG